jgi:hypothetical protein
MKILRHLVNRLHTYTSPAHFSRALVQYDTAVWGVYVMKFVPLTGLENETDLL